MIETSIPIFAFIKLVAVLVLALATVVYLLQLRAPKTKPRSEAEFDRALRRRADAMCRMGDRK
ncbi:hypothetical protein [Marinovum algicola]|uniref:hypothetical protein n=1 Tax=Marinovum algicola TaxID=42444 RepID=UPI003B52C10D